MGKPPGGPVMEGCWECPTVTFVVGKFRSAVARLHCNFFGIRDSIISPAPWSVARAGARVSGTVHEE